MIKIDNPQLLSTWLIFRLAYGVIQSKTPLIYHILLANWQIIKGWITQFVSEIGERETGTLKYVNIIIKMYLQFT